MEAQVVTLRDPRTDTAATNSPLLNDQLSDQLGERKTFTSRAGSAVSIESIILPPYSIITFRAYERTDSLEISVRPARLRAKPQEVITRIVWEPGEGARNILSTTKNKAENFQLVTLSSPFPTITLRNPSIEWNFVLPFRFERIDFSRLLRSDADFVGDYLFS